MGLFNFKWLRSKERQENTVTQALTQALQYYDEDYKATEIIVKPYKTIYFDGSTITVVFADGTFCSKPSSTKELVDQIVMANTRNEIFDILYPKMTETIADTEDDKRFILANSKVLKGHPDFIIRGLDVMMKGINLVMPSVVAASFIEALEKGEEDKYQALKAFWMWLSLNPIESSRNDALTFIKKNDVTITSNGLLELYRRVLNVGDKNKRLSQFVSAEYFKMKRWKKSPSNYEIFEDLDTHEVFSNKEGHKIAVELHPQYILIGNLEDLYLDLPNMQENIYTDSHTKTKIIKVGHVYKEDEENVDLDNSISCSRGLHVGSSTFMFEGFGDTGVLALVNPMKIRSVPNHESNKMRVSEMFVAAVVDINDYKKHIDEEDLIDYSEVYCDQSLSELEKMVEERNLSGMECQSHLPAVSLVDMNTIKEALRNRITKINIV